MASGVVKFAEIVVMLAVSSLANGAVAESVEPGSIGASGPPGRHGATDAIAPTDARSAELVVTGANRRGEK